MHQTIFEVLEKKVNKIAKEVYAKDSCPPEFTVSLIQRYGEDGKINAHEIGLTIRHNRQTYTRTIFPVLSNKYGYPPLEEEMRDLYNNTM